MVSFWRIKLMFKDGLHEVIYSHDLPSTAPELSVISSCASSIETKFPNNCMP